MSTKLPPCSIIKYTSSPNNSPNFITCTNHLPLHPPPPNPPHPRNSNTKSTNSKNASLNCKKNKISTSSKSLNSNKKTPNSEINSPTFPSTPINASSNSPKNYTITPVPISVSNALIPIPSMIIYHSPIFQITIGKNPITTLLKSWAAIIYNISFTIWRSAPFKPKHIQIYSKAWLPSPATTISNPWRWSLLTINWIQVETWSSAVFLQNKFHKKQKPAVHPKTRKFPQIKNTTNPVALSSSSTI